MMKKPAFVTIEDSSGCNLSGIATLVVEDFPNMDMYIMQDTESYFVIKFIYDDFIEVQEVISNISYTLIQEGINNYTTILNCDD